MKYDGKLCFCGQTVQPNHCTVLTHILRQKHFLHWSLSLLPSFTLGLCVLSLLCLCFCPPFSERKVRRKWFFWFNSFHFRERKRNNEIEKSKWRGSDRKREEKKTKLHSTHTPSERDTQVDRWSFFSEFETMLPFCHLTKSCAHLNKLHTSNTCVDVAKFFRCTNSIAAQFFSRTSDNKKIEVENFQLVDSFKKFSNEFWNVPVAPGLFYW